MVVPNAEERGTDIRRCLRYREKILELSQSVGALHIAPAFSCLEMIDVVYNHVFDMSDESADRFILSKGHGAIALYTVLADLGVIAEDEYQDYCKPEGILGAHPDRGVPGIIASTGSLGHGLGLAVGVANAKKIMGLPGRVVVLVSDGELQEGSTWEGIMMAANLGLSNLTVLVDANDFGGMDRMSEHHRAFYPIDDKFSAFGWMVSVVDGHNHDSIKGQLIKTEPGKPSAIVCQTVKGRGVPYMENNPIWHYRSPNEEELAEALVALRGGSDA